MTRSHRHGGDERRAPALRTTYFETTGCDATEIQCARRCRPHSATLVKADDDNVRKEKHYLMRPVNIIRAALEYNTNSLAAGILLAERGARAAPR